MFESIKESIKNFFNLSAPDALGGIKRDATAKLVAEHPEILDSQGKTYSEKDARHSESVYKNPDL